MHPPNISFLHLNERYITKILKTQSLKKLKYQNMRKAAFITQLIKYPSAMAVLLLLFTSSCKKEDSAEPAVTNSTYTCYLMGVRDLDGEFHLDSDGDGDIDGFGTCINTAMAEEIEDHINNYSWIQEPYVKVKANLTDAPNFKYQITQILEKGVGGY